MKKRRAGKVIPKKKIPLGIKIWAYVLILMSVVVIIALPVSLFFVFNESITIFLGKGYQFNVLYSMIVGAVILIESAATIVLSLGVLRLDDSARRLLIKLVLFIMFFNITDLFFLAFSGVDIVPMLGSLILSCIFYFSLIFYLDKRSTRAIFR